MFGRFELRRRQRQLLKDGVPVDLSSRGFDILAALIDADGAPVSKDELIRRVWPDVVVEENNLTVQISALRKALGNERDRLRTLPRHGYSFAADAEPAGGGVPSAAAVGKIETGKLPVPLEALIGREDDLQELLALQGRCRLLTLTGPGGIGKTRLALELARRRESGFPDGAFLVELATQSDAALVPASIASTLGLQLGAATQRSEAVAAALREKKLLLVLDNCEHVVAEAARTAETLLHATIGVQIIATSREPLRADGEVLYRVSPLRIPGTSVSDPDEILRHGAVHLFITRARATGIDLSTEETQLPIIAAICRRLDGIPLAIELAAARVPMLGVAELFARLDNRLAVLSGGRRTALPRHQTLRATLDWSYDLLAEVERVVLRRLSIFAGVFGLEAAEAISSPSSSETSSAVDALSGLIAKSLVSRHDDASSARYRLLETTRAYAREKLRESGEFDAAARRHAEYYRDLFERAEAEWQTRPTTELLADYGPKIDNLRAALDWTFSPDGDPSIGVALTAATIPLWTHLSLMEECRSRVEQALAALSAGTSRDARREMQLHTALGMSLIVTRDAAAPEMAAALTRTLEIAASLDDAEYQLRALWGLWLYEMNGGRNRAALARAERFYTLAAKRPDPSDRLIGERMIGVSQHLLGDQASARRHIEHMLAHYVTPVHSTNIVRFQFDQRVVARCVLAKVLWLQGFPDQAVRTALSALEEARSIGHELSFCNTLTQAVCPITLEVGDLDAAEHYTALLFEHAARYALTWHVNRALKGTLLIRRGDLVDGIDLLRTALDESGESGFIQSYPKFIGELADGFRRAGQAPQGLLAIDEGLALCERDVEPWCVAELFRIKGELLLLQGAPGATAAAEDHFRQALGLAHQQGALSWELRAATSLARLLHMKERAAEAAACLRPVCNSLAEGFDTADFKAAKALLDTLES